MKSVKSIWLVVIIVIFFCVAISFKFTKKSVEGIDQKVVVNEQKALDSSHAKNIILLIGDGMGPAHRELIRLMSTGPEGEIAMNDMPYLGLSITNSTSLVTDSAAAATAMATGVKSYNGAIGVDPNKNPVESILEKAKKAGKATGIVTTSEVTDATGAAFGAHVEERDEQTEIANQYLENNKVNVILGGGKRNFINLVNKAKGQGYTYVTNTEELYQAKGPNILGLFAKEEMYNEEEYAPSVSLVDMTKKAINILSKHDNGFFLVVEEEAIDSYSHDKNPKLTIKSGKELNKAVDIAKEYAKINPNTLIIVAADHETGGLAIEEADSPDDEKFSVPNSSMAIEVDWTTSDHTAVFVPVTSMGPGAEKLTGFFQNTHIYNVMLEAMNTE